MIDVHTTTVADLRREATRSGKPGTVAIGTATGAHVGHFTQASRRGRTGEPQAPNAALISQENRTVARMIDRLHEGLPVVVRRSARQRYEVLLKQLIDQGLATYKLHGYAVWPRSVQDDLRALGWKDGDPGFLAQAEALASHYIEKWSHVQKEKDQRRSTLDWHGHLNA